MLNPALFHEVVNFPFAPLLESRPQSRGQLVPGAIKSFFVPPAYSGGQPRKIKRSQGVLDPILEARKLRHMALNMCAVGLIMVSAPAAAQHMNAPSNPCLDAGSMVDTSNCLIKAHQEADTELNQVYRQIMRYLDGDEQTALRSAQRAWISYRDKACAAEAELYDGGSAMGIVRLSCLWAATKARSAFMAQGFWWRVEKHADTSGF